jgi:hypothetical protein
MKKKVVMSACVMVLLFTVTVESVSAQIQAVPGVSTGDMFTYESTYRWSSSNPNDVVPAYLVAQNQSTLEITVQQVTGSTAVLQQVITYKNGTQQTNTEPNEVNSGITGTILLYAANLTAGGLLFPGSTELPFVINGTSFRDYMGGFRETNHIEVNNTGIEGVVYSYMDLYFDRQTGVLVEYYLTNVYSDLPNQKVTQHMLLTNSNVWTVPEFPPTLILPLFMAASIVAFVLYKRNIPPALKDKRQPKTELSFAFIYPPLSVTPVLGCFFASAFDLGLFRGWKRLEKGRNVKGRVQFRKRFLQGAFGVFTYL